MEIDLKSLNIYCNPAVWNTSKGKVICGVIPYLPYEPELYKKVKEEYERRCQKVQQDCLEFFISSKKDPQKKYRVTKNAKGIWSCECKGFQFRKNCSHIDTAKGQE
jgi:hypothetical protein